MPTNLENCHEGKCRQMERKVVSCQGLFLSQLKRKDQGFLAAKGKSQISTEVGTLEERETGLPGTRQESHSEGKEQIKEELSAH